MPVQAVQISLDRGLLKRLDADPEVKAKGRSAFIRDALRVYLRARERARIDERIRAAYGGRGHAMLREVESLLGNQAWPDE
jgi:metal-responsive CopG/Arc/MetJ family transcriptional regulator